MRTFDDVEKSIIQRILDGHGLSRNLISIFDSINALPNVRISIDTQQKSAEFLFQSQSPNPSQDEINKAISEQVKITEQLIQCLVLFRHLEKEELVIFFDSASSTSQKVGFGCGAVNEPAFSMPINDAVLIELLTRYAHKEIHPTPSLKFLRNNNFNRPEDIRFRRQQIAAWSAIAVSMAIGVFGICNGWRSSQSQARQTEEYKQVIAKFSTQLEELAKSDSMRSSSLSSISASLAELKDKVNLAPKNQTIEVKLVKDDSK